MTIPNIEPNYVQTLSPETNVSRVEDNTYEFNPGKGWLAPWWRALWRALVASKCVTVHFTKVRTVKWGPLNEQRMLIEALTEAVYRLKNAGYRPRTVFMGSETFAELAWAAGNPTAVAHFNFTFNHSLVEAFRGIPIKVVPWLDGWFVDCED